MRRFRELSLVRDMNPVFALTWTIMHEITPDSPLAGLIGVGGLDETMEIVVVLSGVDERSSQTIYARWAYGVADIRPNARFADILGQGADGVRTIDYRRFHEIEAVE